MWPGGPNHPEFSKLPAALQTTSDRLEGEFPAFGVSLPPAGNPDESDSEEGPSYKADSTVIIQALRRRWVPLLLVGTILAALAGITARLLLPQKFTARVKFQVATRAPALVFQSNEAYGEFGNFLRTQVELIKSPLVLDAVLIKPEVAGLAMFRDKLQPLEWLEEQLVGDFPAPEILRLTLSGKDPQEIETLLTAISEVYLREVVNKEKNQREDRLRLLSVARQKWEQELSQKRRRYRDRAKEAPSGDAQTLAYSHRLAIDELNLAKEKLLNFQSELLTAEVQLKQREMQETEGPPSATVHEADVKERLRQDRDYFLLLSQQDELERKIKSLQLRGAYAKDHPTVQQYNLELQSTKESLVKRERELRPLIEKQLLNENRGSAATSVAQLRSHIAFLKEMEKQLISKTKRLSEQTASINVSSLELDELREDISQTAETAKKVASEAEAIKMELNAPTRVTQVEKTTVIHAVDGKKQLFGTVGAAVGGFAIVLLGFVGYEVRARRVLNPAQVSEVMKIRVIGTLPTWSKEQAASYRRGGASTITSYPRDLLTESVDRARLKLLNAGREQPLRVILITSAIAGEGKTSLAGHLAVSLARAGRRTLLIDADLHRPAMHRLFDLSLEPGFSAVLRGELPVADAIRPTYVRGLEAIPAGRGDLEAIRALGNERVRAIFQELKEAYEFILVDSAPVLAVVDAPVIAQYVDGVLFSVMCGVSHLPSLYQSQQEIAQLGVRILGAVVSGTQGMAGTYGYSPALGSAK